jgi:hypothetical protein
MCPVGASSEWPQDKTAQKQIAVATRKGYTARYPTFTLLGADAAAALRFHLSGRVRLCVPKSPCNLTKKGPKNSVMGGRVCRQLSNSSAEKSPL